MSIVATLVIVLCNASVCTTHETASWQSFGPDAQYRCDHVASTLPTELHATCDVTSQ